VLSSRWLMWQTPTVWCMGSRTGWSECEATVEGRSTASVTTLFHWVPAQSNEEKDNTDIQCTTLPQYFSHCITRHCNTSYIHVFRPTD